MQSVDVAIVGGGMVGLAVACGLQGSGLRVAVLEQRVQEPLAANAPPQLRVSAINAASEKLLTRLGVWQDILSRRASCYHGMEVWDKDSFGHISFDDQSMGYSHLNDKGITDILVVDNLKDSDKFCCQRVAADWIASNVDSQG